MSAQAWVRWAPNRPAQEVVEVIEYQATDRDGHWPHGKAWVVRACGCPLWAGLELITITRKDDGT